MLFSIEICRSKQKTDNRKNVHSYIDQLHNQFSEIFINCLDTF